MPARLRMVTIWSDLQAAGGTLLGPCWEWDTLTSTYRQDGDDRVAGTIGRSQPGASHLTQGAVLRYEREDDSVEEWITQVVEDRFGPDRYAVTGLPARVWLKERVLVRNGTDLTLSDTDTLSNVLDTLIATDEWPAWVIAGTVDVDPTIAYDWNQSTGLDALLAMAVAANADEAVTLANDTVRVAFRRVSDSQYAIDFLTSAVSGSPYLEIGKSITGFSSRQDRTVRASAIYPVNASGVTIAEAMFVVRSTSGGTIMDMRDWAYRDDFLGIAFDGQWVGWYAVAPDGTTSIITGSTASTQQLEVADNTAWGSGNNATVRIAQTSGGTPTVFVADTTVVNPRQTVLAGTWTSKINWLPNSRWDEWASGSQVRDWAVTGGFGVSQEAADFETGTYACKITYAASAGALTVSEVLMPDEVVSNGGGTQTWRVGMRCKLVSGPGGGVVLQRSIDGGSSWGSVISVVGASWTTVETTFTTTAAILPNRPRLQFSRNSSSGVVLIDRVWLFRDGVDDDDNTFTGNGPSVGFYTGQRALLAQRTAGTIYEVAVADRYRNDPAGYPNDNLLVNQQARIVVPTRGVDVTVPIAQLEVNELAPLQTTIQVGAQRRRLTTIV